MRTRPSLIAGPLIAGVLACALLAAPSPSVGDSGARNLERAAPHSRVPQTSDGVIGEMAAPMPAFLRGIAKRTGGSTRWQVAPGVTYIRWNQTDARGPIRAHLLTVDLSTPGLALDYAGAGVVRNTDQVSDILARHRAIAGVNGDFFDIGDTGAPLGLGQDRQLGFLHAPLSGWNSAFFLDRQGNPDIGYLPMKTTFKQHPNYAITNVNSPEIRYGGIGVYTPAWGSTSGYRVTGGQTKQVRMVRVLNGRIVETKNKLTSGQKIRGFLMIGRGAGAAKLASLRKGSKVTITGRLQGSPQMAITGNKFLVRSGVIEVINDREMHPRTAIGIDRDTNEVLILVIDGRQSFSRGYTMVELADLMIDLGADEALNLDGGGSTTMVARSRSGAIGVVNSPSDGAQRAVANAIEVTYAPPAQ